MIRSGNFIDFAIIDARIKNFQNSAHEIPTLHYDSDHRAIQIIIQGIGEIERGTNDNDEQIHYNFTGIDWNKWTKNLEDAYQKLIRGEKNGNDNDDKKKYLIPNNRNLTDNEINNYIEKITKLILDNIKTNSPKKRRINNMMCYSNPIIEKLYKHKSFLISKIKTLKRNSFRYQQQNSSFGMQQHHISINNHKIKDWKNEIKRTTQLIEQNIKIQIELYWTNVMKGIRPSPKMWTEIKKFTKSKKTDNITIKRLDINENDIDSYKNFDIDWTQINKNSENKYQIFNENINLNIIGQHIEDHTKINSNLGETDNETEIKNLIEPLIAKFKNDKIKKHSKINFSATNRANTPKQPKDDPNYFISTEYLEAILNVANNKKSYGPDMLPNIVLKHLPHSIINEICILFNNLLNNRSFPECWKLARVFPILKKNKKPTDPENYRPISLLSNLGKIYEIILYEKINEHVCKNNLMPDNQFGFRFGHNTVHAITKLVTDVCHNLNYKNPTGAIMIDIKKAFESIWLDGLLAKLTKMNFSTDLIQIIYELLYNRNFIVTTGKIQTTQKFKILNGVQQGSITAPILFNLYTAELINHPKLNSNNIQTCAYADDMIIYSSNYLVGNIEKKLQSALNFLQNYLNKWHIEINITKCETILFRQPLKNAQRDLKRNWRKFSLKIYNQPIKLKETIKYLGVNIDHMCYMAKHMTLQLEKARRAFMGASKTNTIVLY